MYLPFQFLFCVQCNAPEQNGGKRLTNKQKKKKSKAWENLYVLYFSENTPLFEQTLSPLCILQMKPAPALIWKLLTLEYTHFRHQTSSSYKWFSWAWLHFQRAKYRPVSSMLTPYH